MRNNIHFVEKDIGRDAEAARELQKRNVMGVPAILIGDDIVMGLDRERILKLVDHRVIKCDACGKKLRVPTRKGRITVTCPNCKNRFDLD